MTDSDIAGFIAAFRAARRISDDIGLVVISGSARAAYMPSTGQRWGLASFALAPGVPFDRKRVGGNLEPPINQMVFMQPAGCPWTYKEIALPFPCPNAKDLPAGVRKAWALQSPSEEECRDLNGQQRVR